jgi:hypothetical protein
MTLVAAYALTADLPRIMFCLSLGFNLSIFRHHDESDGLMSSLFSLIDNYIVLLLSYPGQPR